MRRPAVLLSVLALAGCGDDEEPAGEAATPAAAPAATGGAAPYIASLTVDPGDGTVVAGTGLGAFRIDADARTATPFDGELATPDGSGAISPNLVLRFTGPGELIGSGHPKDAASGLPEYLGLIRSGDGGRRWEPVSLLGEEDLHALDVRGDVIAGQPVEEARLLVSDDAGRTWEERTAPSPPLDVDLDPSDPDRMAITTLDGLFVSADRGGSWRRRDVLTTETHLAWAETGALYRVDAAGTVKVSEDGGERWTDAGTAGAGPTTATVDAEGRLYVALTGGVIVRSEDGGRTFEELATLR
jgi:hypothetical protein